MKTNKSTSALITTTATAICIALCIVLPMAFHAIPNAGVIFSPMHIPVLLCGLTCGPFSGLCCGILGPMLSSLLTGMPAMAILPPMMLECAVYGLVSGLGLKLLSRTDTCNKGEETDNSDTDPSHDNSVANTIKSKRSLSLANLYISLIIAMLTGRIAGGLSKAFIFMRGSYVFNTFVTAYFVTALPGIILQLIVVPLLVVALRKAGLVPKQQ